MVVLVPVNSVTQCEKPPMESLLDDFRSEEDSSLREI